MTQKSNQSILVFILLIAVSTILISVNLSPSNKSISAKDRQVSTVETRVLASQSWTNTEVLIQPADILTIQYVSGLWSPWSGDGYDGIGSGGVPTCDCNLIFGVSHASLIGKIGEGSPFFVGNEFTQPMAQSGYLYLGINDTRLNDNSGSILVRINISESNGK